MLLVELRHHVVEFSPLARDACQVELRLGLGEPQGWSVRPEGFKYVQVSLLFTYIYRLVFESVLFTYIQVGTIVYQVYEC
jgi:hypothetical protein